MDGWISGRHAGTVFSTALMWTCGLCMFSLCWCVFSPSSLASSHIPNTFSSGERIFILNICCQPTRLQLLWSLGALFVAQQSMGVFFSFLQFLPTRAALFPSRAAHHALLLAALKSRDQNLRHITAFVVRKIAVCQLAISSGMLVVSLSTFLALSRYHNDPKSVPPDSHSVSVQALELRNRCDCPALPATDPRAVYSKSVQMLLARSKQTDRRGREAPPTPASLPAKLPAALLAPDALLPSLQEDPAGRVARSGAPNTALEEAAAAVFGQ